MIASFMVLIGCYIAENICHFIEKPLAAKIFHKIYIIVFFLFVFCFLSVWSYAWIKDGQYFPLLFTIPFWICGIYMIRKHLFGIQPKVTQKQSQFDLKIFISFFLVGIVLLIGIVCLYIGIKDTYNTNQITKDYITATAYFTDYEIYNSSSQKNTTYRLTYVYHIEGKEYMIKTDYGSESIPNINSTREIKYNPYNPSEAVFIGTNRNSSLIYFGAFFLLGGMVFVLIFLYTTGIFDKIRINIIGLYVGIVLFVAGIGVIAFQMGQTSSFIEVIKTMGFWLLIPIIFIIVGTFQIIKCLFFERLEIENNQKRRKI